jgi:hypothetical protein
MTATDLLAEYHAVLTGCACNRCDVCRVRRLIAAHEPTAPYPDAATLRRWYRRDVDLSVPGGAL